MSDYVHNYKSLTLASYNSNAEQLAEKYVKLQKYRFYDLDTFLQSLPGKQVLELGAGSGIDGEYMQTRGAEVLCTDLSDSMLALCSARNLETKKVDLENIDFPSDSFDGVYAAACLLHLPKNLFAKALEQIANVLRPNGIFFISMKEGEGERIEQKDGERFFSFWTEEELHKVLNERFVITHHYVQHEEGQNGWIKVFCKVRK